MKVSEILNEKAYGRITKHDVRKFFDAINPADIKPGDKLSSRWGQWEEFMKDKWIRKPEHWDADMNILDIDAFKSFKDVYKQMHRYSASEVFGKTPEEDSSPVNQDFDKDFVKHFKGQYFVLQMPFRSYIVNREGANYIRYFMPLKGYL